MRAAYITIMSNFAMKGPYCYMADHNSEDISLPASKHMKLDKEEIIRPTFNTFALTKSHQVRCNGYLIIKKNNAIKK